MGKQISSGQTQDTFLQTKGWKTHILESFGFQFSMTYISPKSHFSSMQGKKMLWRPLKQPEKYTQLMQTGRFWMYSSNIAVTRHAQNIFPKQSTKAQSPEPCPKTNPCWAAPAPRSCHRGRTPTGRQAAWPLLVSPGGVLSSPFLEPESLNSHTYYTTLKNIFQGVHGQCVLCFHNTFESK